MDLTKNYSGFKEVIRVRSEEELKASFNTLEHFLTERIVPFWVPQTTIAEIEKSFRDTSPYPVKLGDPYDKYMRELILASFVGKERFEEAVRSRERSFEAWSEEKRGRFHRLVTFLSSESPELTGTLLEVDSGTSPHYKEPTVKVESEPQKVSLPVDYTSIELTGFDPDGEPEIRMMNDGRLYLVFNFMPPSWDDEVDESFDDFDQRLASAIGVPVLWEDREFFLIQNPQPDTVDRVRQFIESYREIK